MALIISGSIDLNKIDKSKIKTTDKNGNPFKNGAKYYEVNILVNDDIDQYNNNVQITDAQTKEQRAAKEKRNFIGNGRVVWRDDANQGKTESNSSPAKESTDDLPF